MQKAATLDGLRSFRPGLRTRDNIYMASNFLDTLGNAHSQRWSIFINVPPPMSPAANGASVEVLRSFRHGGH